MKHKRGAIEMQGNLNAFRNKYNISELFSFIFFTHRTRKNYVLPMCGVSLRAHQNSATYAKS